jgi:hypothetical protein
VLTARSSPSSSSFVLKKKYATQRNTHQEEYFALDEAELRHVISILKLLALGAHKVCYVVPSSFAYDSSFQNFLSFSSFFFLSFSPFGSHVGGG